MAISLSDLLVTDDLTILLGLIAGTVFLLRTFYRPQPLVHPILLGRQSEVARVRNPGESAVYRNYGTGLMNRFPVRPHKDVHVLSDLVRSEMDAPRTLWNTKITNATLQDRVASFGTGIIRLAGLQAQESNVLLLLNDCLEFIIADLALSSHSVPSITLAAPGLLSPILDAHPPSAIITHADFLPNLLELIYDAGEGGQHHTIIVVGEPSSRVMASVASKVKVLLWEDVEREGIKISKIVSPLPKPTDVFSVSYFSDSNGQLQGTQLTHANLTAGVAATHALFPASFLSSLDTIVSSHSLGGTYGRAIGYTAIFEGTSFTTTESSKLFRSDEVSVKNDVNDVLSAQLYSIPSPTVLFIKPSHLESLVESILREAKKSFILNLFAWRHKVSGISEGFVSKDTLWDRLVYDAARARVIGEGAGTLRTVVVGEGSVPANAMTPARVALSCPVMTTFTHPTVVGPVLASHPLDLQDFSSLISSTALSTVGPPSVSIEAKLLGVDDDAIEAGGDPVGILTVRGPPVGKVLSGEEMESTTSEYVNVRAGESASSANGEEEDGWANMGVKIQVHTNGAFRIVA